MVIPGLLTRFCTVLFVVAALSGAASGQERTACNEDYQKFCKGLMPGGGRVLNCLIRNTDKLKPECRELLSQLSSFRGKGVSMTLMPSEASEKDEPVPEIYQKMYGSLETALNDFDKRLGPRSKVKKKPPVFGAGLPPADSNRGRDLLRPDAIVDTAEYLDELKELGVEGVTVFIGYPLYTPSFPGYALYANFYRQVAQEVKKRDMKLCVEAHVVFANTGYSDLRTTYPNLTFPKYKTEKREMISAIIRDMTPDYLDVGSEPDTESTLTGLRELNDPKRYAEYVRSILGGLERGKTRIAAGVGSWGNLAFATDLARTTSIDALALHIYPLVGRSVDNAFAIADIAQQNGKGLVIDEAWLAKSDQYVSRVSAAGIEATRRDSFSFWSPLDRKFLTVMTKFAREKGAEYISPSRSNYFFSYIDFDEKSSRYPYRDMKAIQERAALASAMDGKVTPTGRQYWVLIENSSQ